MKENKEIKISIIGGINIDITGKSKSPVLMDNSNPGNVEISVGGVACNIAKMLSVICKINKHDSVKVKLYSAVGKDMFSDAALSNINKFGIDTSSILRLKGYRTGTYISILDKNGEMVTAVSDMEIMDAIDRNIIERWETELIESDFLAADTNLTEESLNSICRIAESNKIPVLVDPVSVQKAKKILKISHSINYLTPNEAEYLTLAEDTRENLEKGVIRGFSGVKNIIITRGRKDVIYFDTTKGKKEYFPVHPVYIQNPNGAGDAFAAGFIYALINGLTGTKAINTGIAWARETLKSSLSIPEIF